LLLLVYSPLKHVGHRAWKQQVVIRLGLAAAPDPRAPAFVLYAPRRPAALSVRRLTDLEAGLLFEGPGGLAFLGSRGSRAAIACQEIGQASVERVSFEVLRSALRIGLGSGE